MCSLGIVILVGCSKAPEPAEQGADVLVSSQPMAVSEINEPLAQGDVGARYLMNEAPQLEQGGQILRIPLLVKNTGSSPLLSQGQRPVNLGISLLDDSGQIMELDFSRSPLPEGGIAAGAESTVVVDLPAERVVGKKLRFGLVQESVAWFSDLGVVPLDYGPIAHCENSGIKTLCGVDGKPFVQR